MKHLLYILLSFVVFSACEDDKETVLPYPMNELDDTCWICGDGEYLYYDKNGSLIERKPIEQGVYVSVHYLYFKGSAVLDIHEDIDFDEYIYSVSWKDRKMIIGEQEHEILKYSDSNIVIGKRHFRGVPIDDVPGCYSYIYAVECSRITPLQSFEEYIEEYKRRGKYEKHY